MADNRKRARDDPDESDLDSPEVKCVRRDLLGILADSGPDPVSQDLDSVIKCFKDALTSSRSSQPDLGYLLEASDDELGLPPPSPKAPSVEEKNGDEGNPTELVRVSSGSSGIGEFWEFEDYIPSYDSLDLRVGEGYSIDYVALDDLFEYSDVCFGSSVLRQEFLPAE